MTLIRDRTGLNHADDQDQADSQAAQSSQLSETAAGSELDSASSRKRRVLDPELLEWGLGASQTTAQIPQKGDEDRSDSEGEETVDENAHDESVDEDEAAASEGEAPRAPEESVKSPTLPSTQEKALFPLLEQGKVPLDYQPMGETLDADAYDDDLIFSHLVFYMDTADNAAANGLKSSTPSSAAVNRLSHAETLLKENGGRIVTDILDPKLTHIIMDDDDSGRYVELVRKTSRPKHKHIVLPSWVTESVDEETLMNEDGHKPS
ncbi:DNA ligase (ATP) [Vanrija albida]|uniref:DNA ligase (ATP) n=1 Tax=Vanrija albida TaxID=181172 RepID=A0ABR3QEX3_9TREE